MFRENVLIALTILITILALSFIILMTVYLQMHEMEQRLKRFEKAQDQLMKSPWLRQDAEKPELSARNDYWKNLEQQESIIEKQQKQYEMQQRELAARTTTTTTTEPEPTYYGISDGDSDNVKPEPADAVRFPYHFYGSSGHLTLEVPETQESDSSVDYANEKILLEVMKRLYRHYTNKRLEEIAMRVKHFNGIKTYPLGYYYPFNGKHDRYIWFEKEALEKIAPPPAPSPLISPALAETHNDTTAGNGSKDGHVRKRRKRNVHNRRGKKTFLMRLK